MSSLNDSLRVSSADIVWRACDEGVLVFDGQSGKTSLLNHRGASILKTLGASDHDFRSGNHGRIGSRTRMRLAGVPGTAYLTREFRIDRSLLRLESHTTEEINLALRSGSLRLDIGRFLLKISSSLPEFGSALRQLYADHPASAEGGAYDYDIAISPPSFLRHWFRRNVSFHLSGDAPFLPMEIGHAHALFEWGLNWTIGSNAHNFLILHSAVVELNGCGTLLAATSGSGKSTLAAELSLQGWRLLSDELALIDENLHLASCARPVSLKNQSIEVIRTRHPQAVLGPFARDTHKGTIAHLPPPPESVARNRETALPRLIVFPKWRAEASLRLEPVGSGEAAMRLIDQAFNYPILGRRGFERLAGLVECAEAWELEYDALDDAREALETLVKERD